MAAFKIVNNLINQLGVQATSGAPW